MSLKIVVNDYFIIHKQMNKNTMKILHHPPFYPITPITPINRIDTGVEGAMN